MNPEVMRADFERHYPTATKFAAKLEEELEAIVVSNRLSLAVPLESRVKSLGSILDKLERKKHEVTSVRELGDFVGVRAILLFRRDADELCEAIEGHFQVIEQEDVSARLGESEFGYQSRHYLIELPQDWLSRSEEPTCSSPPPRASILCPQRSAPWRGCGGSTP